VVPGKAALEISHHYGLDDFYKHGITMITVVNREYCKKLIVVLPGQTHPEQFHEKKEETFVVLYGKIDLTLDGETISCGIGDVITVKPGMRHAFKSEKGAVIEEISSTHYMDDSFYSDPDIMKNKQRKTYLSYWID
jgi:N-acetylneuraminate synthase